MNPTSLTGLTLERLVATLESTHVDALDRISDAMVVAEHLDQVGDDLIEHVVATARQQGISWSEIGARMGVSKQAAQQRLGKASEAELEPLSAEQGFARFTIEARNLLVRAHEAARARREPCVSAARIAVAVGIEAASSRLPEPASESQDLVPYDDEAQQALARAFEVAIAEGAHMVEVRHLIEALG